MIVVCCCLFLFLLFCIVGVICVVVVIVVVIVLVVFVYVVDIGMVWIFDWLMLMFVQYKLGCVIFIEMKILLIVMQLIELLGELVFVVLDYLEKYMLCLMFEYFVVDGDMFIVECNNCKYMFVFVCYLEFGVFIDSICVMFVGNCFVFEQVYKVVFVGCGDDWMLMFMLFDLWMLKVVSMIMFDGMCDVLCSVVIWQVDGDCLVMCL